MDVFATANGFLPPERQYQLELVTSSVQPDIEGMCGLGFAGARHYSTLEGELDTLLVRRKLENSTRSLEEIAAACGFNSADVLSQSFQRHLKTTPAGYRARFRTSGAQYHESVRRQPRQR